MDKLNCTYLNLITIEREIIRLQTKQNKPKTIKKMVIGTYISVTTLNVNGLNFPTKDTGLLNRYKNKTHIYAVYKRPLQT